MIFALGETPKCKSIRPPEGGWRAHHWYVVHVSYRSVNPVHKALFYTGFVSGGVPSGYNKLVSGSYERDYQFSEAYYLRAVQDLGPLLEGD